MKGTKAFIGTLATLALCAAALADKPANPPSPPKPAGNDGSLGQVDAILNFCTRVDPRNEARYRQLRQLVSGNAGGEGDHDRDDGQKSDAYIAAYKAVSEVLEDVPRSAAVTTCQNALK
jgi:hypothetical protein